MAEQTTGPRVIFSLNFNGVGGPASGELIVTLCPADKSMIADLGPFRLGWPVDASPENNLIYSNKCVRLIQNYCAKNPVTLKYIAIIGSSFPDILEVDEIS